MLRDEGHVQGELSEFKVAENLVKNGCRVSYTYGGYPYDLIADYDSTLYKVQVKTTSNDRTRKYEISTKGYARENVDLFAGYVPQEDGVFYVPFEDAGNTRSAVNFTSREELDTWHQEKAKFAEDHTFLDAIDENEV